MTCQQDHRESQGKKKTARAERPRRAEEDGRNSFLSTKGKGGKTAAYTCPKGGKKEHLISLYFQESTPQKGDHGGGILFNPLRVSPGGV